MLTGETFYEKYKDSEMFKDGNKHMCEYRRDWRRRRKLGNIKKKMKSHKKRVSYYKSINRWYGKIN